MVYQPYNQTMMYYPPAGYYDMFAPVGNVPFQPSVARNIAYRINEYFFRGLVYIQNILDLILSTSPFLEQYGPILEELPKMYHLVRAFQEVSKENEGTELCETEEELDYEFEEPAPRLFI